MVVYIGNDKRISTYSNRVTSNCSLVLLVSTFKAFLLVCDVCLFQVAAMKYTLKQ